MTNFLIGTGVAIVTPFHKHGTIDFSSFEKMIEHVIANKVEYIVVLGTTGESVTLSKDERNAIIHFSIETINKRVPLVVGIGGSNTQSIIDSIKECPFEDINAILSVAPYYNKPQQRGLFMHYKNIATVSPVPVILYNVPGRTSLNMSAETTLKLAHELKNIVAIKEASGNISQCMEIIKNRPAGFKVISGDDILTLPLLALGADGVISVVANAFPAEFSEMVRLALKGNFDKARVIHYQLTNIIETLFVDGNPSGIKAALSILGLVQNNLRLPLVKVSQSVFRQIENQISVIVKTG
ncbi:MAG: 4-hydroxy-tetrahydrodipicolinate synthase [Bacteroidales bacterium]|jgi:4-hydroxy-tetrahydrodipicolinate synthase|nr:4-hydroxy-tetrahydrodipicolinate synthase [Bacteroidales bacterium]